MTEEELNEIRKFVWNYKYIENYDHNIYDMFVKLIQHIDILKGKE